MVKENHTRKIAVGFKPSDYAKLEVLAKVTGKPPAVCARDIIVGFLDANADNVIKAQELESKYNNVMAVLNGKGQISLFDDDDTKN